MKLKHPLIHKALGFVGAWTLRLLRQTIDWQAVYFDPTTDSVHPRHQGRFVYSTWHEHILLPMVLRGSRRMLALASNHADGDIMARALGHLGWSVQRGSSTRGGVSAMLRFLRDDGRHVIITPDGPRGPRRRYTLGSVFLASKLGLPIVCVGIGFDRPWRLRSWDRFAIPRPFTRARAVFGPPLTVPANLERTELECYRLWFERLLNWLTEDAETWAANGTRRRGALPMLVGETPARMHGPCESTLALPDDLEELWQRLPSGRRALRESA
jgi:lysophospholipid acyltransferase (LPLAT)-like uncharacterized protein